MRGSEIRSCRVMYAEFYGKHSAASPKSADVTPIMLVHSTITYCITGRNP